MLAPPALKLPESPPNPIFSALSIVMSIARNDHSAFSFAQHTITVFIYMFILKIYLSGFIDSFDSLSRGLDELDSFSELDICTGIIQTCWSMRREEFC